MPQLGELLKRVPARHSSLHRAGDRGAFLGPLIHCSPLLCGSARTPGTVSGEGSTPSFCSAVSPAASAKRRILAGPLSAELLSHNTPFRGCAGIPNRL